MPEHACAPIIGAISQLLLLHLLGCILYILRVVDVWAIDRLCQHALAERIDKLGANRSRVASSTCREKHRPSGSGFLGDGASRRYSKATNAAVKPLKMQEQQNYKGTISTVSYDLQQHSITTQQLSTRINKFHRFS